MVNTISVRELRPKLSQVIDNIHKKFDRYVITRRGKPEVVMMSIDAALDSLKINPFKGKPLKLSLKGIYSLRVGVYRILYSINKHTITVHVLKIGHRRNFYN